MTNSSETKFIPGPWEVSNCADFLQVRPVGSSDQICDFGLAPADDWRPEDRDEVLGCASLIAAAPDLYEALLECVTQMRVWVSINGDMVGALKEKIDRADAALSKARGEQTP